MSQNIGGYYKKYARYQRTQTTEEQFSEGMVFTRAPLSSRRARLITNYDVTAEGEAITPRKGIRTKNISACVNLSPQPTVTEDIKILDAKDVVTEDNAHYRECIAIGNISDNRVENTDLYECNANLWITNQESTPLSYLEDEDIEVRDMYSINLNQPVTATTAYKNYCYIPKNIEVNGFTILDKKHFARPVGCFANSYRYFTFNTNGDLIRTGYKPQDTTIATFFADVLAPQELTPAEAGATGYNMLLPDPYTFADTRDVTSLILNGILVYTEQNRLIAIPKRNTKYKLRFYYSAPDGSKYKLIIRYKNTDYSSLAELMTKEIEIVAGQTMPEITYSGFSCDTTAASFKIDVYQWDSSTSQYKTEATLTQNFAIAFADSEDDNAAKESKIYALSKASNILFWNKRLWLYGIKEDRALMFYSEKDQMNYFPSTNIHLFDDPILKLVPFNGNLLAFTKSQIIMITGSTTDNTFSYKVIQGNLDFDEFNVTLIQVIKNMVFFKSGDQYYLVVPKSLSLTNEYSIAPISKNIETFINELPSETAKLLDIIYGYTGAISLVNHYTYLNYEDIHIVYTFNTEYGLYINLALLYNTVDRNWRLYTYESQSPYYPLKQDATKDAILVAPFEGKDGTNTFLGIQYLENDVSNLKDFYYPNGSDFETAIADFNEMHTFKNWQCFDTGYRDIALDFNKRLRELQLKFNNVSTADIHFTTEFILDGETRIDRYKYVTDHVQDPTNPNYGLISIQRELVEPNVELPGSTLLGETSSDENAWLLSASRFPEVAYWKARLRISGKGYTPRFILVCKDEEQYELLGYSWVYRQMYSR